MAFESFTSPQLYLASASPRRRELLHQIGVPFLSKSVAIDETPKKGELAGSYVTRLAREKADTLLSQSDGGHPPRAVLGADTAVVVENEILGKPRDREHALTMLRRLSGREHQVMTAVAVTNGNLLKEALVTTTVQFRAIAERELARYWESGEPQDKAGAYAIQGWGAVFVERIEGSYSAVVGLPLMQSCNLLREFGIPCWQIKGEEGS